MVVKQFVPIECNGDDTHDNFRLCLESLSEYSDNELIHNIWVYAFQQLVVNGGYTREIQSINFYSQRIVANQPMNSKAKLVPNLIRRVDLWIVI
jgi:hypothetical protein